MKKSVCFLVFVAMFTVVSLSAKAVENSDSDEFELVSYEEASYPGGIEQLQRDANRLISYPEFAYEARIEGEVMVEFSVEADGSVGDIVCYDVMGTVFNEAIEHFLLNTTWIPATANGIKVRTRIKIPLIFKI